MKRFILKTTGILFAFSLIFTSCLKDDCSLKRTFYRYDPIYKSLSQIRSGLKLVDEKDLKVPGKIYIYGTLLLINEIKEGIHIFNNENPDNPIKLNFISIPGNVDLSVRNGILYADSYVDLLSININDPENPTLLCRTENVYSPIFFDPVRGLLVDYSKTKETITLDCHSQNFSSFRFWSGDIVFDSNSKTSSNSAGNFTGLTGIGGSMARFTINENYLYTVDMTSLYSFDIGTSCPDLKTKSQIGWNIETIYPYENKLFIGSTSGMFIYSLTNPDAPTLAGNMNHWRSCDPVVVKDDLAYITLHGGTECGGFTNQLDIVNVKDIYNPTLLKTIAMEYPLGLAVKNEYLYICDRDLKIYKINGNTEIQLVSSIPQMNPYDVIVMPNENNIILVSETGITQYDSKSPAQLIQRSIIPVK
ncbi:MAG: hypothetical protein IPG12_00385 [Saprospiraceae bacterium]|nr:hypothetical protein [Saprospiraceae bacterium]